MKRIRKQSCAFVLLLTVLILTGCRSTRPDYSLFPDRQDSQIDSLWRQGYGYNNPNPERLRNGQSPLNFDGRESSLKNSAKDLAGRAIGNVISYGIFEAIPAAWRSASEKIRNLR